MCAQLARSRAAMILVVRRGRRVPVVPVPCRLSMSPPLRRRRLLRGEVTRVSSLDRELLQHAALRTPLPDPLRESRRGGARDDRVDRALLQPSPTAHNTKKHEPDQMRILLINEEAQDKFNLTTESWQDQAAAAHTKA